MGISWEIQKEQKAKIIIIMLTTSLNPDDKLKAQQMAGISGFENKPLTPETIDRILKHHFTDRTEATLANGIETVHCQWKKITWILSPIFFYFFYRLLVFLDLLKNRIWKAYVKAEQARLEAEQANKVAEKANRDLERKNKELEQFAYVA